MKVNGKDYPIYEMENKKVWNHQPQNFIDLRQYDVIYDMGLYLWFKAMILGRSGGDVFRWYCMILPWFRSFQVAIIKYYHQKYHEVK